MPATTFNVSTAAELQAAVAAATGGDTIVLAAGNYGDVSFSSINFSTSINLVSADPEDPATFNTISLWKSSGFSFDSISIDYVPEADSLEYENALRMDYSSNISVTNTYMHGGPPVAGDSPDIEAGTQGGAGIEGFAFAGGIAIFNSTNVTIADSEIAEFNKGIKLDESEGVKILDNIYP